jgi:hypothetical protein
VLSTSPEEDQTDLTGFLTTFVLLARDHFKPQEMVSHAERNLEITADAYVTELDFD